MVRSYGIDIKCYLNLINGLKSCYYPGNCADLGIGPFTIIFPGSDAF